ncbi:MAG: YdcF family protein [Chitinophagaceae bacterium]
MRNHKWLKRILFFFGIWFIIHGTVITIDGLNDSTAKSTVAIVLGNRVFGDGSLASWTKGRVDKAMQLYKKGDVNYIFVSGGYSRENNYPEGKAMKNYLLANGVPDSVIVEDNNGANTYLTVANFLEWNKKYKFSSVTVVSQFYHITRSRFILKRLGYTGRINNASSDIYNWKDIIGTMREVPAFYKYLLLY